MKFRKEIQPKDKDGNPVGQPHVYEAETEQELLDKMADAIANGTLKIASDSIRIKELTLGNQTAPEGIDVDDDELPEIAVRDLSQEERFALSQELRDPEKMVEAFDKLAQARFGRKPQDISKGQQSVAKDAKAIREHHEANAFADERPEFIRCRENADAMMSYMGRFKMAKTKKNFEIAFKQLSSDGLLKLKLEEPKVIPETRTEAPEEKPEPKKAALPGSIRRSDATASTQVERKTSPAKKGNWTSEEIKKMFPELANAR